MSNYESLAALATQMRIAADQGDWDQVIRLEQQCNLHVAQIKSSDETTLPDEPELQNTIQLIKKILADNADIRHQTEARMIQLKSLIESKRQERRLNEAYGQ